MSEELKKLEEKQAFEKWELMSQKALDEVREETVVEFAEIGMAYKIGNSISAAAIKKLMDFQAEKKHEALGFKRFADFLDNYERSPLTKNQFYERKKLFEAEGELLYELMNKIGLPMKTRKMLAATSDGEISIEGNTLTIGENTADMTDLPVVKHLIEQFVDDKNKLQETSEQQSKKIETLESTIEKGKEEYEELRRNFEGEETDFEKAFGQCLSKMVKLNETARQISPEEKEAKGENVLQSLWTLFVNLRSELNQNHFQFHDFSAVSVDFDPKVIEIMSDADDLD